MYSRSILKKTIDFTQRAIYYFIQRKVALQKMRRASMKIRKYIVIPFVILSLMSSSLVAHAEHTHVFRVYNKHLEYVTTKPCVTQGCTVTIYYYYSVYICSCGDTFGRDEIDDNHHSMMHNNLFICDATFLSL